MASGPPSAIGSRVRGQSFRYHHARKTTPTTQLPGCARAKDESPGRLGVVEPRRCVRSRDVPRPSPGARYPEDNRRGDGRPRARGRNGSTIFTRPPRRDVCLLPASIGRGRTPHRLLRTSAADTHRIPVPRGLETPGGHAQQNKPNGRQRPIFPHVCLYPFPLPHPPSP